MKPWLMALAFASGRRLLTQTLTSTDTSWTAPDGVTVIEELRGRGSAGEAATYEPENITISSVSRRSAQSGGSATTRGTVFNAAAPETEKFRGSGARSVSYTQRTYTVGPDNLVQSTSTARTARVRGDRIDSSFTGGTAASQITYDDSSATVRVRIEVRQNGSTGAAATGFGKTFPGGFDGPASFTTFTKVAIVPGQAYPVSIPVGGSIIISYYV